MLGAMIRVLELSRDRRIEAYDGSERAAPPPEDVLRWIDVEAQTPADMELLRERFDLHPLVVEDCLSLGQRPKLESYGHYLFIVTQGFICAAHTIELEVHELHCCLGDRYLISVHKDPMAAVSNVWSRIVDEPSLLERGIDFAYYLVADRLVDDNFPILDRITEEIERLEEVVLERPDRGDMARLFALKHQLVSMRKVLSPQRDVFGLMAKRGDARVSERTALYLRDIYDHLVRISESIETNRDLLGNTLDAYLSAVSQRTNEIMKSLTLMSAIFLPLAFIVGFFGQNFVDLPGIPDWVHSDILMWIMIAACLATPIGMYSWFRLRKWL
jgi:magnesium transporter